MIQKDSGEECGGSFEAVNKILKRKKQTTSIAVKQKRKMWKEAENKKQIEMKQF